MMIWSLIELADFDEASGISCGTEIAPRPHLFGQRENSSEVSNNKNTFPSLDSALLSVVSQQYTV